MPDSLGIQVVFVDFVEWLHQQFAVNAGVFAFDNHIVVSLIMNLGRLEDTADSTILKDYVLAVLELIVVRLHVFVGLWLVLVQKGTSSLEGWDSLEPFASPQRR